LYVERGAARGAQLWPQNALGDGPARAGVYAAQAQPGEQTEQQQGRHPVSAQRDEAGQRRHADGQADQRHDQPAPLRPADLEPVAQPTEQHVPQQRAEHQAGDHQKG
jgi:hypothetical protein